MHHLVSSRSVSIPKTRFIFRGSSEPYLKIFRVKSTRFFFLLPQILLLTRKRRSFSSSLKSYSLIIRRIVRHISQIVCLAHLRSGSLDLFLVLVVNHIIGCGSRMVFLYIREGFPCEIIGIPDYLELQLVILPSMESYGEHWFIQFITAWGKLVVDIL